MSEGNHERLYYRVREIRELIGVSKSWVFAALKKGKLEGKKLGGLLLITADSFEKYLDEAEPWEPREQH